MPALRTMGQMLHRSLLAALFVTGLGACSDPTELLFEIGSNSDTEPDRLRLYVGTSRESMRRFVEESPTADISVSDRNLAQNPYSLLVTPGKTTPAQIMVAVVAWKGDEVVGFSALPRPVDFVENATAKWTLMLEQDPDVVTQADDTCLRWLQDGTSLQIGRPPDRDCDGSDAPQDCDDNDPKISPLHGEVCGNQKDDNCNGDTDENLDEDNDSVKSCDGDCDDKNAMVNPNQEEVCDGFDNDCKDGCDSEFDQDGDSFSTCSSKLLDDGTCEAISTADCADDNAQISPKAEETCDGADNDCSGRCEDSPDLDPDGDTVTECGSVVGFCGSETLAVDCKPDDPLIFPGAAELCNGHDDTCDGLGLTRGPCATSGELCRIGQRDCDDSSGTWAQGCDIQNVDFPAPNQVCDAFATCEANGAVEPLVCALKETGVGDAFRCVVNVVPAQNTLCEKANVILPPGEGADCHWSIVAGQLHDDYLVGFVPVDNLFAGPTDRFDGCTTVLDVKTVNNAKFPGTTTLVVRREQPLKDPTYFVIYLSPRAVSQCLPPNGLACDGLENP